MLTQAQYFDTVSTYVNPNGVDIETTHLKCKMNMFYAQPRIGAKPWVLEREHSWRSRETRSPNSLWLDIVALSEHPALKAVFAVPSRTWLVKNANDSLYFEIDCHEYCLHVSLTQVEVCEMDFRDQVDCNCIALVSAAGGYRSLHGNPFPMFD